MSTTLLDRGTSTPLFHRPQGSVTRDHFLLDAHTLAAQLPPGRYIANLCRDRYAFAVAFAAALLREKTSLLNIDPAALPALATAYPGCTIATDTPIPACGMPATLVTPIATPSAITSPNPQIAACHQAAIVFTSGTTGTPVAHPKSWAALVARSRAAAQQFALEDAAIVGTISPQHMYGFETTVLLPFHAPVTSWCGPAFFPADIASALRACPAPRILVTTPLQLRTLLDAATRLPPLAACISATAPLDPTLAAKAEDAWQTKILEIFGATECGSIASRRTTDGPIWTPYPGIDLEITLTGTTVHAPVTSPVQLADILEPAPNGFRLLGRRTDLVKLAGRRASLTGLNQLLNAIPGIDDGAFVVPDDHDTGAAARLVAIVVAPSRTTPSILADLRRVLDPIFLPRRIIRVDALPRNALGKLPRQALLQLVDQAT